jgi:two-component system, NarL family, nitrate/nitrite response regulator NarL
MKKIAVLLVDARPAARQGLRAVLAADAGIEVTGEAANQSQARRLARKYPPDAVVVGVVASLLKSLDLSKQILRGVPSAKVFVLASLGGHARVRHLAAKLGGLRFLIRQTASRSASLKPGPVSRGVGQVWSERLERGETKGPRLTRRELQVLQSIANGLSNKQIAAELGLSIKTVEKHRQQVMDKLNIHGIAGLTRYAIFRGMLNSA